MKAAYFRALLGGSTLLAVAVAVAVAVAMAGFLVSMGQHPAEASPAPRPVSVPDTAQTSVPVPAREAGAQELIAMAEDALTTRLLGADEIQFSRVSTNRIAGGKQVVCGSVTFKQPVYLPARTEKFIMVFPERATTLESGHPNFSALAAARCVRT